MEESRIQIDSKKQIRDDLRNPCGLGATLEAGIQCWLHLLSTAVQPAGAAIIQPAAVNATTHDIFGRTGPLNLHFRISSYEPLLLQQLQQRQQDQGQLQRQTPSKQHGWHGLLLLFLLFPVAKSSAAASYSAVQNTVARRLLQHEQQPTLPLEAPPPPPPPPPQQQDPHAPSLQPPESPQPDRPKRPTQPSAPPPPAFLAFASTSKEFFHLLYLRRNVTEIRLVRDIKLLAVDAIDAMKESRGVYVTANADANISNDTETEVLGPLGMRGPLLDRNLTVMGFSRGTHTRLDMNFLASILRLETGVRLTLQKLELYKALNQLGQVMDFVGKSDGGDVILEDCVQRRPACLPFSTAAIQILSLPYANDPELQNQPREMFLRNDSAFCWSTSTLVPNCKQPSMDVNSFAVHTAASDGVFLDSGGYDVCYINSHIVCDYPVDSTCLQTAAADRCLARELVRRFGDDAEQLFLLAEPLMRSGGPPASPTGMLASQLQPTAAGHDSSDDSGDSTIALSAGLAGGVGGLALLVSIVGAMVLRQWRRRRWPEEGAAVAERKRGNAADARTRRLPPAPSPPCSGGPGGWEGRDMAPEQGMGVRQQEVVEPAASRPGRAGAAVTRKDTGGSGGGDAGGDTSAVSSCCSQEVNSISGDDDASSGSRRIMAMVAAAAAAGAERSSCSGGGGGIKDASDAGETTAAGELSKCELPDYHYDIESIRESLLRVVLRNPGAPLQVLSLLGEGSFGKVYKGIWQGTVVALKTLMQSGNLTQDQRMQQMAIMEAAISSSMSHPNIVQMYTYSFRPIHDVTASDSMGITGSESVATPPGGLSDGGSGDDPQDVASDTIGSTLPRLVGYELRLVIEFCDRGSLRQALNARVFHRNGSGGADCGVGGCFNGDVCIGPPAERQGPEQPLVVAAGMGPSADDAPSGEAGGGLIQAAVPSPPLPDRSIGEMEVSEARRGASLDHGTCFVRQQQQQQQEVELRLLYNYGLMLQVACDVASALLHLHNHGLVHGDVKASNVLLKKAAQDEQRFPMPEAAVVAANVCGGGSASGAASASPASLCCPPSTTTASSPLSPKSAGLIAKVADFGLSTILGMEGDVERTHVTALTVQGRISKRVDVYAFGILLYELFTADRAHRQHQVAVCGLRPSLPCHTPPDYRRLTEACWAADPANRLTFEVILAELERMRAAHGAAITAAALTASCGASCSTSASRGSRSAFSYGNTVRPDGWVLVSPLESSTC